MTSHQRGLPIIDNGYGCGTATVTIMPIKNHLERLHPEQAHTSINFQESFLAPGNFHRSIIAPLKGMCPFSFFMEYKNLNTINLGKVRLS